MTTSTLALIGLGSNLGDRRATLERAIAALAGMPGITVSAVSSLQETPPVGGPEGQGAFLNAAALLETTLDAEPLLDALNAVEALACRVRTVRWGARTLDLDLLLFGSQVIRSPRLIVPHPRMAVRRFVLAPAYEVAPTAIDPVTTLTIGDLLANVDRRPSRLALCGEDRALTETVIQRVALKLGVYSFEFSEPTHFQPGLSAESLRDRWLVTAHEWPWIRHLDSSDPTVRLPIDQTEKGPDLSQIVVPPRTSREVIPLLRPRPTFAAILSADLADQFLVGMMGFPYLIIDPSDVDRAVREVVDACAATRS